MSFVEVLVATVFIGTCAAVITDSLGVSLQGIARMERRMAILSIMKTQMESVIRSARTASPIAGTTTSTPSIPGGNNAWVQTVVGDEGSPLWDRIQITATWPERKGNRTYTETMRYITFVRTPND